MELDLGPRTWGTRLPAYGKSGTVEGTVKVHSFRHVDRIVVRLIGKLHASHILNHIPTLSQTHTIISREIEVWSAKAPLSSTLAEESQLRFSFTLDKAERGGLEADCIPPSATVQLNRANGRIAYAIRVDMYRRGLHLHEMIQTEILHLPRTTGHYSRPFIPESGNEKRPSISEEEWDRLRLERESGKGSKGRSSLVYLKEPELLLPRDLRFPSGEDIPFLLCLPTIPETVSHLSVQLVRLSTVQTRAGAIRQAKIVSEGCIYDHSEPGSYPKSAIQGTINSGEAEKDVSWSFGTLLSVSHEIRVSLSLSTTGPSWKLTQPIELTSHEWRGEQSTGLPSLGSSTASRTSHHNAQTTTTSSAIRNNQAPSLNSSPRVLGSIPKAARWMVRESPAVEVINGYTSGKSKNPDPPAKFELCLPPLYLHPTSTAPSTIPPPYLIYLKLECPKRMSPSPQIDATRQSLLGIYYEAGLYSSWPTVLIVAPVELDMEMLPSYSPEVLPGYELTPTASITSSSGPRSSLSPSHSSYLPLPAYGRGGMVQGTVAVRTFRHVDKVVVRSHMIVNKTIGLWPSEASSSTSSAQGDSFPFSFVLEGDDEAARPIPASGSTQLTRAQASVAYVVRVHMYRRDTSARNILYIPRTISRYYPPFMPELGNEKRPQISESEWHSDDLLLERSRTSSEPSAGYKSEAGSSSGSTVEKIPRLWVPRDLRYPSGKSIPFMLSLPTARADSASDIESGIEVQLVRVSTIQTRAGAVQQASTVSRGRIQPSRDQGRTRTLRGTIDTGSAGKRLQLEL
ncbi:hypothetical protein RHS01_08211 [Rhizoctonia solani]|uniref:Uncharacterized protein n=1 Tax=Rhizoctonia solani TaxID=456999 RepID=A0A8H7I524_9AGAM|nr:hypothetical protein RHS01_08211 [Rhizoctonia solani]